MNPTTDAWTLHNVSCTIANRHVFSGASFTIARGQVTTVIGPSGAGKSSLLEILVGFREPSRGSLDNGFAKGDVMMHPQVWESFNGLDRVAKIQGMQPGESGCLLIDEPEKGIDSQSIMRIHEDFANKASKGSTIIVATHDHRWVKTHENTIVLRNGTCKLIPVPAVNFLEIQQETIEQLRR